MRLFLIRLAMLIFFINKSGLSVRVALSDLTTYIPSLSNVAASLLPKLLANSSRLNAEGLVALKKESKQQ
jgi:hypothetical protein